MSHKVIFFGTPQFAVPSLERLVSSGMEVIGVVTAPDKPAGRNRVLVAPLVKVTADRLGLRVLQPTTLKDDAFFEQFSGLRPDVCVIVAYGKIVPERYLEVPDYGFLNVHPSLLPKWRGPSPIQATLKAGSTEAGVSIMQIDAEMDHGPVLAQEKVTLDGAEHLPELSTKLSNLGADLLVPTLAAHLTGELSPSPQDHNAASFCSMVTREDTRIDWSEKAVEVVNRIRAFSGEPNAWTTWNGNILNIIRTGGISSHGGAPGTVARDGAAVTVAAGDASVILEQVQLEGGRALRASDFVNGRRAFVGSMLE